MPRFTVYPSSHYVTPREHACCARSRRSRSSCASASTFFQREGKLVEAQRIEQRTRFDLEMLNEIGFCKGIENYSRHLSGRKPGEPPPTLIDYLPRDALMFIDESHVTIAADRRHVQGRPRAQGEPGRLRLPPALGARQPAAAASTSSRQMMRQTIFVSATPADYEREHAGQVVEQVVRPTGLVDPQVEVRPATHAGGRPAVGDQPARRSRTSACWSPR